MKKSENSEVKEETVNDVKAEKSDKKELSAAKKALETALKEKEEVEAKAKEANDSMLRIAAEYDNFRRRAIKEKEDAYTDSYIEAVKEFLPVMDNLERAKQFANDEGSSLILKQLEEVFAKLGVEKMDCEGKPFDPNYHNAVMIDENSDKEENTVTAVLQNGYILKGKVIRFAMVKVAK